MPSDPTVCRWCLGRKQAPDGGTVARCVQGCFEEPVTASTCTDCGREYETGERMSGQQCWQCGRGDLALVQAQSDAGGKKLTRYTADQIRRGMDSRRSA